MSSISSQTTAANTSINEVDKVIHCYDQVAESYASKFLQELDHKPLDKLLLQDFARQFSSENQRVIDFGCGPGQTTKYLFDHGVHHIIGTDISSAMIEQAKKHHLSHHSDALRSASSTGNNTNSVTENQSQSASSLSPELSFEVANMLQLQYPDNSFDGAISFYSIVNFNYEQIAIAFQEISRVLKVNSIFLFSFHIGDSMVQLNNFLDKEVEISFFFLDADRIHQLLQAVGLQPIQTVIRYPYSDIEHQSKRAYITAQKML